MFFLLSKDSRPSWFKEDDVSLFKSIIPENVSNIDPNKQYGEEQTHIRQFKCWSQLMSTSQRSNYCLIYHFIKQLIFFTNLENHFLIRSFFHHQNWLLWRIHWKSTTQARDDRSLQVTTLFEKYYTRTAVSIYIELHEALDKLAQENTFWKCDFRNKDQDRLETRKTPHFIQSCRNMVKWKHNFRHCLY